MRSSRARLDLGVAETLRFVLPRFFDRVMAYPHLLFPLSRKLEMLAPEVFLPGVGAAAERLHHGGEDQSAFRRSAHARRQSRDGPRDAVAGLSDGSARHAVPAFLAARSTTRRTSTPIHQWYPVAARRAAGEHRDAGAADPRTAARALPARFRSTRIRIDAQENRPGGSSPPVAAGRTDPKEMDPAIAWCCR